jgi:WD40 repeat protein
MKKENAMVIAGETRGGEDRGKRFDVIYVIDTRTNKLLATWQDPKLIKDLQKVRYHKAPNTKRKKYLFAAGTEHGFLKLLSFKTKITCLFSIRAHEDSITKLHITRVNRHPYCISESDDNSIKLWNFTSTICLLRKLPF